MRNILFTLDCEEFLSFPSVSASLKQNPTACNLFKLLQTIVLSSLSCNATLLHRTLKSVTRIINRVTR